MNPSESTSVSSRLRPRWAVPLLVGLCVLAGGGLAVGFWVRADTGRDRDAGTFVTRRGPLVISVTESGTIKNREQIIVKSEVQGRNTILWLIEEGVSVNKGDRLVDLDSSKLEEQKVQQQIVVLNAEAGYIRARENLAVTESQGKSDVAKAELVSKFAKLDLEKYLKGEYPQELRQAQAQITIADEELQRATDKLKWSRDLAGEGYITRTELEADKLAAKRSKLDLELAEGQLGLLKEYTHKRKVEELESDISQAKMALDRVKRKAGADEVQAEAEFKAKDSEFTRQKSKLDMTGRQITKCKIAAPVAGMVVYATTGKGNRRGNVEPLDEGQDVRERQELIYLPTTTSMIAEVKVHESSLRKVREQMPARIQVDALPGKSFSGRVAKIGLLPDAISRFMNPDLKVYSTQVYVDGDGRGLRAGMTCRVEIIVEQYDSATYVPVQSVVRLAGRHVVYVPGPDGPEPRPVEIGLDNNRVVHILNGLSEGQEVLLAPPLSPADRQAPAQADKVGPRVPATSAPATRPGRATTRPARPVIDPNRLRGMTREQREALRSRRGDRDGGGGGRGSDGAGRGRQE